MFGSTAIRVDADGVTIDGEKLAFADIVDARVARHHHLVLISERGEQRVQVARGKAFELLERVLDGVAAAHPQRATAYRTLGERGEHAAPSPRSRLHRTTASVGPTDLWVGRVIR